MILAEAYRGYEAFLLDEETRQDLAERFPPKYPEWIGHHITHKFGVFHDKTHLYGQLGEFSVVGYVDDGEGLEALIVSRDGNIYRPDGKIYHITWSLDRDKGKKPVQSNELIAKGNWQPVATYRFNAPLYFLK